MTFEIHKTPDYNPDILLPIWKDALPDLDARRIEWSYENNPHGRAILYLLYDTSTSQYFGVGSVIPRVFILNGIESLGGLTADFAIKKEYRSLSPALRLQKEVIGSKDFDILLAFPNLKSEGVQLRAGFKLLGNLKRYSKVLKSAPILKKRYNPLLSTCASPFVDIYLKFQRFKSKKRKELIFQAASTFDIILDEYHSLPSRGFSTMGKRDPIYLKWRFEQNPYKSFQVFWVRESPSKLIGYLIFYVEENIAYVVDFQFAGDSFPNMSDLFESFTSHCVQERFDAISLAILKNDSLHRILRSAGFFSEPTKQKVLFVSGREGSIEKSNIFLTSGDCDF